MHPSTMKGLLIAVFRRELKPKTLVDKLRQNPELFFSAVEEILNEVFDNDINVNEGERGIIHAFLGTEVVP